MPLEPDVKARIDQAVDVAEQHLNVLLKDPKLRPGVVAMLTLHLAHYNGGTHKYLGQMYNKKARELASPASAEEG